MTIDLFIDTATGEISRTLTGPKLTSLVFTLGDIPDLQIRFATSGANSTATVLASSAVMRTGIRAFPGSAILARSTTHTLNVDSSIATASLNLNTEELSDFFDDTVGSGQRTAQLFFEVEVTNAAGTKRLTYMQVPASVRRGVHNADDGDPTRITGSQVSVPETSTSTGTAGDWASDSDYFYRCVATDTWRRWSLNDW